MGHIFSSSDQEAEAEGARVRVANLDYTVRPYLKKIYFKIMYLMAINLS